MTRCAAPPVLPPGAATIAAGKVSIVVLNWNAGPFLERALASIVRHTRERYELVVVDNGSVDGSKELVRRFLRAHPEIDSRFLDHPANLYFSRGFNLGLAAAAADAEYVMVFCNDVEVKEDDWLRHLMAAMQSPGVIAAGHADPGRRLAADAREIFVRNRPHYSDPGLERRMYEFIRDPDSTYTHLYGYCFLLRRSLLTGAGLYLEGGDFKQYHSDWEWYVRFKMLGFEIAPVSPKVHHWHGISELVAFYPELYQDLLGKIADPVVAERYLHEGRPLYPQESGYRELQRKREEDAG